jgi:HK97 family phage prohead protease
MSQSDQIERRVAHANIRIETRAEGGDTIKGHAAVFNSLSEDLGGFREKLLPGAFRNVLTDDVRALINHDSNLVLGRSTSGTLTMSEDERGLYVEIVPPATQAARDLMQLMQRGDVTQMSFAFSIRGEDQQWTENSDGSWLRTIGKVARLYDVSVVTYPAYPETDAAVRELRGQRNQRMHGRVDARARYIELLKISVP